jgi:hypothetical protein
LGAGPEFPIHNILYTSYGVDVLGYVSIEPPGPVGVRLDGSYNYFTGRTHDNIYSGTASALFKIPAKGVKPYIIFGLGYYKDDREIKGRIGFDEGVGIRVPIQGRYAFFGEIRAHNTFVAANYIPMTFGVQFPL